MMHDSLVRQAMLTDEGMELESEIVYEEFLIQTAFELEMLH